MSAEVPHVLTIADALRNLDEINFDTHEDLAAFLNGHELIGAGREALVLRSRHDTDKLIKIHLKNALPVLKRFLGELVLQYMFEYRDNPDLVWGLNDVNKTVSKPNNPRLFDITEKIAAHNSLFRADSRKTPPINGLLLFKGKAFGYQTKFLEGHPAPGSSNPLLWLHLKIDGGEAIAANTLTGITNSISDTQIIDLEHFIPSDELCDIIAAGELKMAQDQ